jgi:hypothetical protein
MCGSVTYNRGKRIAERIVIDLIGYFVGNQGFDSGLTGAVDELLSKPQASQSLFTR